jgi:glycosyltransferase involved in cell wall biosynthesis
MPVFDPMCGYLLWKARGRQLSWPEENIPPTLLDGVSSIALARHLKMASMQRHLDSAAKNALLRDLAGRLDVDFDELCTRRILHLMNPDEVTEASRDGVDFQLHCHRHRVYRSRERFWNELRDNADVIERFTGQIPKHFCYPGGLHLPDFPGWLAQYGIQSACTCEIGLATCESDRYLLPRLLDTPGISMDEFSAWLSGLASVLPRTHYPAAEGQLIEEEGSPLHPEKKKPLIILLAYYFSVNDGTGAMRPIRFHKYFERLGYRCTVVTASTIEPPNDMSVIMVPDYLAPFWEQRSKKHLPFSGHVERLIRKIAFPGSTGLVWSIRATECIHEIVEKQGSGNVVVFTTFPPVGVLITGILISLWANIRWIADFRDPLAADEVSKFFPRAARLWFARLEKITFRLADVVIANTEGAAQWWRLRYPDLRSKLHVVWNGFDPEEPIQAQEIPASEKRTLLHAGQLYAGRNADFILLSLGRLRGKGVPEALHTNVVLLGAVDDGANLTKSLYDHAASEGWLTMLPPVDKNKALRLTAQSDGLLLLQPQSVSQVPAKLYEYICIGRPILALVPRHSAVEYILERSGIPYVCIYPDSDPDSADRAILQFLKLPSTPVPFSPWFEEQFNGRRQAAEIISIIENMNWPEEKPIRA